MTDFSKFGFDPEALQSLFKHADFTKMMQGYSPAGIDAAKLWETQQKNLEALIAANQTAASGVQAVFAKQVAMLEEAMADAKAQLSALDQTAMDPKQATAQTEAAKASFERTLKRMGDLAETAQTANGEAFEIVAERVKAAMSELRDAMSKKT